MPRNYALAAVFLVILLLAGASVWLFRSQDNDQFAECRTSRIAAGKSTIGGPFTLVNKSGQTVTDADVLTKPSLIYFGYTYCPDVCPADNARNAEAIDVLTEMGLDVIPIFITVDPARDTPEVIGEFSGYMHEKMIGLTGTPEQIKAASLAYKTYYRKNGEDDDYLMDHSTFTYLTLPGHGFVEFFRREITAEAMASTVACFVGAS